MEASLWEKYQCLLDPSMHMYVGNTYDIKTNKCT